MRRRLVVLLSASALLSACGAPEPEGPAPVEPSAAPSPGAAVAASTGSVTYACESGQAVTATYLNADSAQVAYGGRTYATRSVQSASGARYVGEGVEWWTASRNGQEGATLSRLGPDGQTAEAVLERCTRPTAGAAPQTPPGQTPVVGTASGANGTAEPCRAAQLRLSDDGGDAGMGHRVSIVGVQNTGAQPCSLLGYPTVTVQDGRGRALSQVRAQQNPGGYLRAGQSPAVVTLAAQGKAFFDLAWTVVPNEGDGETTCPTAARVRVAVPNDAAPLSLDKSFTPCGRKVEVSPFRAVAEPDR